MPRDRLGLFYSSPLPKYRRYDHSTDQTIIDLFDKGLSNQGIANHLCGASYSKQTVSNITDKCIENIDKFKSRQLSKEYAVVYTDATRMALRRDTVAKEAQLVLLLKAQKRF